MSIRGLAMTPSGKIPASKTLVIARQGSGSGAVSILSPCYPNVGMETYLADGNCGGSKLCGLNFLDLKGKVFSYNR